MRNEDVYRQWRQSRRQVTTDPDFRSQVMNRIARDAGRNTGTLSALIERISIHRWVQAAAVAAAAVIGIGRILLTFHMLLFA
jgi:hypothetical protein